ncbi:cuticle protein 10.9-like [Stegodyphus dumicola]|uniref:cuticle protein 10.9-like n=1 Tax=Stegodyphus dumicola TaxID=202533 RepID=UPI0015A8BE6C|nr:cuticle protein 10.9-like [Stegodyphus dumicola]XP_035219924.1 cuticle protein 10.9-like [Stegodyphus dumicola]
MDLVQKFLTPVFQTNYTRRLNILNIGEPKGKTTSARGLFYWKKMLCKVLLLASLAALASAEYGFEEAEQFEGPFEAQPYSFGYSMKNAHGEQHRHESSNGAGRVTGSYGFVDEHGIHRIVHYIADHLGFRAKIITNEPGTANQNPAGVIMESTHG